MAPQPRLAPELPRSLEAPCPGLFLWAACCVAPTCWDPALACPSGPPAQPVFLSHTAAPVLLLGPSAPPALPGACTRALWVGAWGPLLLNSCVKGCKLDLSWWLRPGCPRRGCSAR